MNDNKKRKKEKTKKRKKKKTRTELPREAKKKKLADAAPTETATEEPPKKRKYKRRDKTAAAKAPGKGEPNEHADFTVDDLHTLISRIEEAVPVSDALHYEVSATKLNWRSISFSGHSPKKCQDVWATIQKKQRSYRLLSEVVGDVKEWCKTKYQLDFAPKTFPDNPELVLDKPEKPPFCGYSLYLKKLMKEGELKQCSNNTWMKFVAERWKELPQNEKDSYNEQAKELKNQYKLDYDRYIASLPREQRDLELLKKLPKKRSFKDEVSLAMAKKEKKAEPEEPQSDLIAAVKPALWDNMSVEDKLMYQKCILKVRNYFEQQCASDQQSEKSSSSESGSDSDSSNN